MDGSKGQDIRISLPPEDGSVEQALLELDSKLDAWAETILQTQTTVKNYVDAQLNRLSDPEESLAPPAEPLDQDSAEERPANHFDLDTLLSGSTPETENTASGDPIAEPIGDSQPTGEGTGESQLPQAAETEETSSEAASANDSAVEIQTEVPVEAETAAETQPSPEEDDEALLASLEPEVAKKIQVLRRLSNKQKSVRELLEQVKSEASAQPAEETKSKKRFFWRK